MRHVLTALALAGVAAAQRVQMPLPAFSNTFTSPDLTRGLYFQAPPTWPFIIAGLRVPDESGHGLQNVEVLTFPTDPTGVSTAGSQRFFSTGQPSANIIPTSILINPGEWVGVYGACGDATTMRNSYGVGSTFTSDILGTPVDIDRLYTQVNIVANGGQNVGFGTTGPIGRVEVYVTPSAGLFPSFHVDVDSGASPLTVNFTDTSYSSDPGGILSWVWDFDNDGTPDSNVQNPSHTYTACGTFDVSLTVLDATHGTQSLVVPAMVETDALTAGFITSSGANNTVTFTDTSTLAPTGWAWDFDNDGVVDSTAQNPTHAYPAHGIFTPTLTVANACRTDTHSEMVSTFQTLCAESVGGNGLPNAGAGNLFDLTITNPNGVLITALDVSAWSANPAGTVEVWLLPFTYVAGAPYASAWHKVSEATGVNLSGIVGQLDLADIDDIYLAPGTYGMRIATSNGVRYTIGTSFLPANNFYANADITLAAGAGQGTLGGTVSDPRVWNGCIHYSTDPADGFFSGHRAGCDGSVGRTTLGSATVPAINQTHVVDVENMPANGVGIMVLGYGDDAFNGNALPLGLWRHGAPDCPLNIEAQDSYLILADGTGNAQWSLMVPNVPAFIGTHFLNQVLVIDPGFNELGAVMSDSAVGRVGG